MASNSTASGLLSLDEFPAFLNTQKNLTRYTSRTETKPNHPWYQIDKDQIDSLLKEFKHAVIDCLKGSPEDDKELQHLIRNADKVANVHRSPPIEVALIGAQGAGKSRCLNAIFDCDDLSPTGAGGAVCTRAVTKYVDYASGANSNARFIAEIRFLNPAKREALLEEHAHSYYQYQHADEDFDDDDSPLLKKWKRDLMDRRLKDTALDVFTALFGSRDAFLEHWSAGSYRNNEFVRTCNFKCQEALQNESLNDQGVIIKSAHDHQSLIEEVKSFLTNVPDVCCLWPLVDDITIRFSNDLLKAGIEFIDLPGWGGLNLSRARHVEAINDDVDVVMILTDTVGIASDDRLVAHIQAAVAHHGASKVKIVATKIDAVSETQPVQYTGGVYDEIKLLETMADEQDSLLEDDSSIESFMKRDTIAKYKSYLTRATLQAKVTSRIESITNDLAAKLQSQNNEELPQIFHTSASEYMEWIKPARITFKYQPSLPVEMTGIPAIRNFLYTLSADQNFTDYGHHIYNKLPAFLDKIKRAVTETDRNGGFICISEDFNKVRKLFMAKQLSGAKAQFQKASNAGIAKIVPELTMYKEYIQELITDDWSCLRAPAFTRIVKNRGLVPKGLPKTQGLEGGADWNRDLAKILAPVFEKWSKRYQEHISHMLTTLAYNFSSFHRKINRVITEAAANVPTVEKAKQKWEPLKRRVLVKLETLMDEVDRIHTRLLGWATMEHEIQSSLVSSITDDIFIEVFNSVPPVKPLNLNAKMPKQQYVTPKIKFQQAKLRELFLTPDNHFVEKAINLFQSEFDKRIHHTIDQQFAAIEALFDRFDAGIRAQGPINFKLRPDGKAIRAEMKERIPELQKRINELKLLLPSQVSLVENAKDQQTDTTGAKEENDANFATTYNKVLKRSKSAPPGGCPPKKIAKQDHVQDVPQSRSNQGTGPEETNDKSQSQTTKQRYQVPSWLKGHRVDNSTPNK